MYGLADCQLGRLDDCNALSYGRLALRRLVLDEEEIRATKETCDVLTGLECLALSVVLDLCRGQAAEIRDAIVGHHGRSINPPVVELVVRACDGSIDPACLHAMAQRVGSSIRHLDLLMLDDIDGLRYCTSLSVLQGVRVRPRRHVAELERRTRAEVGRIVCRRLDLLLQSVSCVRQDVLAACIRSATGYLESYCSTFAVALRATGLSYVELELRWLCNAESYALILVAQLRTRSIGYPDYVLACTLLECQERPAWEVAPLKRLIDEDVVWRCTIGDQHLDCAFLAIAVRVCCRELCIECRTVGDGYLLEDSHAAVGIRYPDCIDALREAALYSYVGI